MMRIDYLGDHAVQLRVGHGISPDINRRIHSVDKLITDASIPGIIESVPAYDTLLLCIDYDQFNIDQLPNLDTSPKNTGKPQNTHHIIPVCYGGNYGPDLETTAKLLGISPEQLIRKHTQGNYIVYCLGFSPGFTYLGGLSPDLASPRLNTPRTVVPPGSVAIGGQQTGIYALPTGGGWRLIGQTPLNLFTGSSSQPCLVNPGDDVTFEPITQSEFGRYDPGPDPIDSHTPNHKSIYIINTIGYSSIQARPRYGYRRYGIPPDGPLNYLAMACANMVVGNMPSAPAMEILGSITAQALEPLYIALTCGSLTVDGVRYEGNQPVVVNPGQIINAGPPVNTLVCYLAVSGGIDGPFFCQSASFNASLHKPITTGDVYGRVDKRAASGNKLPADVLQFDHDQPIRITPGPEPIDVSWPITFTISDRFNRMGLKLSGTKLSPPQTDLVSAGVVPGTIQLPPDGEPIVLLAGCGTTGGYHRIMTIISPDLDRLCSYPPYSEVSFIPVGTDDIIAARREYETRMNAAASMLGYRCILLTTGNVSRKVFTRQIST